MLPLPSPFSLLPSVVRMLPLPSSVPPSPPWRVLPTDSLLPHPAVGSLARHPRRLCQGSYPARFRLDLSQHRPRRPLLPRRLLCPPPVVN
eukprot:2609726-Pyramimonas_sp.AAC.1